MNAKAKLIDGIFPINTTKCVYIDGTSTTLDEAIKNGDFGGSTQVSTSGRGMPLVFLREKLIVKPIPTSLGVGHEFATNGVTGFLRTPSGSLNYFALPKSIILGVGQAYVYDFNNGTFEIRGTSGTNEYTKCLSTEIVLYSNYGGIPQGYLKDFFVEYSDKDIVVRELESDVLNFKTTQGIFIVGDYLYTTSHSNDEHTDYATISRTGLAGQGGGKEYTHNLGHLNSCDYSHTRDMLLTGNSSKSYTLTPEAFIFKNWANVLEDNTKLEFDELDKIIIKFEEFKGEYKWNFAWGAEGTNTIWALCCDMRILRKITLGVDSQGDFDGSYTIDRTWYSDKSDIIGGVVMHKGFLYAGVKGEYGIRKIAQTDGMVFKSEYIKPNKKAGDMQGVAIYQDDLICVSDSNCTKVGLSYL